MVKPKKLNTNLIDASDLSTNEACLEIIKPKTNKPLEVTNLATNLDFLKDL